MFVHRPFEVWPALGEWHMERVYMIFALCCWLASARKTIPKNQLNWAIIALVAGVICSSVCSLVAPFPNPGVENWLKVALLYFLIITTIGDEHDLKSILVAFVIIMAVYMGHSMREYFNGKGVFRMGTWRMVGVDTSFSDPNSFSATIVYALPMLYPLWRCSENHWHRILLGLYAVLSVACVLLSGSRGSFVGMLALASICLVFTKRRFLFLLVLCVAVPVTWGALPEDRRNRFMTIIDPSYGPKNAQESADGRTLGWQHGVELFQSNPLTGVGPGAFPIASGLNLQAHHLYGQLLGEVGLIGAIPFVWMVLSFFGNSFWAYSDRKLPGEASSGFANDLAIAISVAVVLLLLLGLGSHNLFRYTWLWYAAFQVIAIDCIRQRRWQVGEVGGVVDPMVEQP